jgi:phosphate ABC transporter, permease protein PstC
MSTVVETRSPKKFLFQNHHQPSNRCSLEHGYFFREKLGRYYTMLCGSLIILLTAVMVLFIAVKGITAFTSQHPVSLLQFLFSTHWQPDASAAEGGPRFGALTFISGSISVSGLAILFSAPLAIMAAVLIAIIAPGPGEYFFRPVLELFTGIPSVVYGWVGLSLLVPWIRNHCGGLGFSLLAGSLVLALMILPTITTLAIDALQALPASYTEGSYALGATRWQTIYRLLLPAARSRILIGITLGLTRAFGEALAVQMVIGNSIRIPSSLLNPMCTLTSIITMDMGNTVMGSGWNNALWAMALLLLLITFGLILIIKKLDIQGMEANGNHA